MDRHIPAHRCIELGTASTATQGQPILSMPEQQGYQFKGLLAD